MTKGSIESNEALTAAVRLREMIRDLEIALPKLKGQGERVRDLLHLRDTLSNELVRLEEEGLDLRPERTRIETIDNTLTSKASVIDHELRSLGGLAGVRREENPPEERWWWYVDIWVAKKRRKALTRALITIAAILVVVFAADQIMTHFFGLSPTERKARDYQNVGDTALYSGEYEKAIQSYEQAVATDPKLAEAHITLGVLYELNGEAQKSRAAFDTAAQRYPKQSDYLMALARGYQAVRKVDKALAAATQAVQMSPNSPEAYLVRGGIYEDMAKSKEALDDYQTASDLAQKQGQDTIYVLAKMRFGQLLQAPPAPSPTPTPSS